MIPPIKPITFLIAILLTTYILPFPFLYGAHNWQTWKNESLFSAATNGMSSAIKPLINSNADVNYGPYSKNGDTPLIAASYYGHIKTVRALLEAQADVNQQNRKYETALGCTIEGVLKENKKDYEEIITLLLNARATINSYTGKGKTAFTLSLSTNHWPTIEKFILTQVHHETINMLNDAPSPRDVRDTPLISAARSGHLEATRLLLQYKASPDIQNNFGHTALMIATWRHHNAILDTLLEANADITLQDKQGQTALTFAMRDKNKYAVQACILKMVNELPFPVSLLHIIIDYILLF